MSGNAATEFFQFEEHLQKLVFNQLLDEHKRLLVENKQYQYFKEETPYLDRQLYIRDHKRTRRADESLKQKFLEQWHYATPDEVASGRNNRNIKTPRFDVFSLISHGTAASELVACDYLHHMMENKLPCGFDHMEHEHNIKHKISSALLLYRITSVFGNSPQEGTDGYK